MLTYLNALKDVQEMYREGLITDGELLMQIYNLTLNMSTKYKTSLYAQSKHLDEELKIIKQLS